MLKETHTIFYIQQINQWIEGNEEETTYAQATESLKVVPINIQQGPKVVHKFKATHEPLVKALSNFENMESHGELIKPIFWQLITWTPFKEEITLLELFGGIGTGFEALPQSRVVVRNYFYVDINPIAKQVAASKMMELKAKFPQQFATTAWKVNFTFLPSDIQLIPKKTYGITWPYGPHHFKLGVSRIFSGWIWKTLKSHKI
jgi:hypothetical protein